MNKTKPKLSLNYIVGIKVPDYIKDEINCFIKNKLNNFYNIFDWINIYQYHLTFAYLGRISEDQRKKLITVSDKIQITPFSVSVRGLGFYPPGKNPRYLRLGIDDGREKLSSFAKFMRNEIAEKSGILPKDEFYPNITIAKIKQFKHNVKDILKFINENWDYPFGQFKINEFHLYRITPHGYKENHKVILKKSKYFIWN
jgi:2'-5' RNA ligase